MCTVGEIRKGISCPKLGNWERSGLKARKGILGEGDLKFLERRGHFWRGKKLERKREREKKESRKRMLA